MLKYVFLFFRFAYFENLKVEIIIPLEVFAYVVTACLILL